MVSVEVCITIRHSFFHGVGYFITVGCEMVSVVVVVWQLFMVLVI